MLILKLPIKANICKYNPHKPKLGVLNNSEKFPGVLWQKKSLNTRYRGCRRVRVGIAEGWDAAPEKICAKSVVKESQSTENKPGQLVWLVTQTEVKRNSLDLMFLK